MKGRVVIAGGSGFLGDYLKKFLGLADYEVVVLSRSRNLRDGMVWWDGERTGEWCSVLDGAFALINLSGRSIDCRYTKENREAIISSRVKSTRALGKGVKACKKKPSVWLNAGSACQYAPVEGDLPPHIEATGKPGSGFLAEVSREWERVFNEIEIPELRRVILRIGVVLGRDGGAFVPLRRIVRLGLGGKQGDGYQFLSWLHIEDFGRIVQFLLEDESASGAYNCVSPKPVTNYHFMAALRKAFRVPVGLPSPKFLLEIGGFFMGTEPELILGSHKVYPERLLNAGLEFKYKCIVDAFSDLCGK